jgi:hypothetical protein
VPPLEIQPEAIAKLHQINQTVFLGFVVDEESGQPLTNALVRTEPSGNETRTDARGYFQIYVPVQTLEAATNSPARLIFAAPGFRSEERTYLELWSEGDWIYRIRLDRGAGIKTVDERNSCGDAPNIPIATWKQIPTDSEPVAATEPAVHAALRLRRMVTPAIIAGDSGIAPKLDAVVPVRIPDEHPRAAAGWRDD